MTSQRQLDRGSTGMCDVPADVEIASLEELEYVYYMVALWNRAHHYIFIMCFLLSFFFRFFLA